MLPNSMWLQQNGYHGLVRAMSLRPELFAHILKNRKRVSSPSDWVPIAENLVSTHGHLPRRKWLNDNGFSGLAIAKRRYPHLFQHLRQESKQSRTVVEWVKMAEQLEKQHGKLPTSAWLDRNNLKGLRCCINKYPERFSHIKRSRGVRRPEEWLPDAEAIARKHGYLPHRAWLQRNGHNSLDSVIYKHPEVFKHLKRRVAA